MSKSKNKGKKPAQNNKKPNEEIKVKIDKEVEEKVSEETAEEESVEEVVDEAVEEVVDEVKTEEPAAGRNSTLAVRELSDSLGCTVTARVSVRIALVAGATASHSAASSGTIIS